MDIAALEVAERITAVVWTVLLEHHAVHIDHVTAAVAGAAHAVQQDVGKGPLVDLMIASMRLTQVRIS